MQISDLPNYLPSSRQYKDSYYGGIYYYVGTIIADTTSIGGGERMMYMFKSTSSGKMFAFPREFVERNMEKAG